MSDYPASLGDLTDVEVRIDARITRLEKRQEADAKVTDEKFAEMREKLIASLNWIDGAAEHIIELQGRILELEKLWIVARENPSLVRELAAEALKGRGGG